MADFLNLEHGKEEDLAPEQVPQALAAGTHVPTNGRALVSPGGDLELIPLNSLREAVTNGYKIPTQDQLNEFANRAKYGGDAQAAKAFGLGALRGATFGGTDAAMAFLGGDHYQEDAEAMKKYHPFASTAGEMTGAVGSALLAPEASPAGLVSKLGTGVAERLAPEGASALQQIAAHAAGYGAEGAVYGLGQSVSEEALGDPDATAEHLVANVGLGALLGGGLGGVLQAGKLALPESIGAAKKAGSTLYEKMIGKAPEAAEKDAVSAAEAVNSAPEGVTAPVPEGGTVNPSGFESSPLSRAMAAVSGKPEQEVLKDLSKGYTAEAMTQEERKKFAGQTAKSFQDHYDAMKRLESDTLGTVRREETANLINDADQSKIMPEYVRLTSKVDEISRMMREEPELYSPSAAREMELLTKQLSYIKDSADSAEHFFKLDDAKRDLYKLQKGYLNKLKSMPEQRSGQLIQELYGDVKTSLENPEVWGTAGARQAEFNDSYNAFRTAREQFEKKFGEKVPTRSGGKAVKMAGTKFDTYFNAINDPVRAPGREEVLNEYLRTSNDLVKQAEKTHEATSFENVDLSPLKEKLSTAENAARRGQNIAKAAPGGMGFFTDLFNPTGAILRGAKALTDPQKVGAMLSNMEKANQKVAYRLSNGMKAVFRPVSETARKGAGVLAEHLTPEMKAEKIKAKINETRDHLQSTENLVETLHQATSHGFEAAPKTMAAVQQSAVRGLQFLQTKIPQVPPTGPFEEPLEPTNNQLEAFDHYHRVVHDPLTALDEMKAGQLEPSTVETLQAVYPKLLTEMQQAVIEHVATIKDKTKIPYRAKLMASMLLGSPADLSFTPESIQSAQQAMMMPAQQQQGQVRPTVKGMEHLNLAAHVATDFQSTSLKERNA